MYSIHPSPIITLTLTDSVLIIYLAYYCLHVMLHVSQGQLLAQLVSQSIQKCNLRPPMSPPENTSSPENPGKLQYRPLTELNLQPRAVFLGPSNGRLYIHACLYSFSPQTHSPKRAAKKQNPPESETE